MYCFDASPKIVDCTFLMNRTLGDGAGICCDSGSFPNIVNCVFRENYAPFLGWYDTRGGGIHCRNASPKIVNCTFYGNTAIFGSGLSCDRSSSPVLENCIIGFLNSTYNLIGSAVHCSDGGSRPILRCCDLYANPGGDWVGCIADQRDIDGNFSADPWFCDPKYGNFALAENSPCAPLGNSCATLIGASAVGCGPKYNRTWYVKADGSGDAPTIQAAIDSCMYEDTVSVANGVYRGTGNRDIAFRGKRIVLRSEEGAQSTTIDCEGASRGFSFLYGYEDSTALVQGFSIRHGAEYYGGGVCCDYSSPKLVGCIIEDNEATEGGGIELWHSNSVVVDCVIRNNAAQQCGGGMHIRSCNSNNPRLFNCTIEENHAPLGGAISCDGSSPVLTECLLGKNTADSGGAIYAEYYSNPALINSVLHGNSAVAGSGIFFKGQSMPSMEKSIICFSSSGDAVHCWSASLNPAILCSNIFGNAAGDWVGCIADQAGINGNFSLDPLFCDTAAGDFHLAAASPCNP